MGAIRCKYCGREMIKREYGYWTITDKEFDTSKVAYFSWCEVGRGPHPPPTELEIISHILNRYEA